MRIKPIHDHAAGKEGTLKSLSRYIDWPLLLFLVLFLDVKLVCKVFAIVLIYVLRPDFRPGLGVKRSRLPLFYPAMIGIAFFDWLLYGLYTNGNYTISLVCVALSWTLCLMAVHQVRLSIERSEIAVLHRTLRVFFLMNAAVSFLMLAKIMIATRTLNPYAYQGGFQKYFLGTGDYIKGLSFDTSSTNAFINAFGVLYFLYRKKAAMLGLCMTVLLLTGSNATILLLLAGMVWAFFFRSDREQKSLIVVCLFVFILFIVKVSPENNAYVFKTAKHVFGNGKTGASATDAWAAVRITDRPDSVLSPEQKKEKIATRYMDSVSALFRKYKDSIYKARSIHIPVVLPLPEPDLNDPEYQNRDDTTLLRRRLMQFVDDQGLGKRVWTTGENYGHLPGKFISLLQTGRFLKDHPGEWVTGTGAGRFSSKQAFRSTALGIEGKYPAGFRYISKDFLEGHLALYLFYFTKGPELRSMLNTPNSVYDQLLSEYGLLGLAFFAWFYIGFFIRSIRRLSYGIPLLFIMGAGFFTEYWFEQLSVVVLFECLLLLDMREGGKTNEG